MQEKNLKKLSEEIYNSILETSFIGKKLRKEFLSLKKEEHITLINEFISLSRDLRVISSLNNLKGKLRFYYDAKLLLTLIQMVISEKAEVKDKFKLE